MPRVNRELQQRMDARRQRDRRSGSDRRYRFTPAGQAGGPTSGAAGPVAEAGTETAARGAPVTLARAARPASSRSTPRTYAEYAAEYAYVLGDLRRIALIVGSLLLVLIGLALLVQH